MDTSKRSFLATILSVCSVFRMIVAAADPNCTYELGNILDPSCPSNIKINWWTVAPYVYELNGKGDPRLNGTLKDIIERVVRKCCGECVSFTYLPPLANANELKNNIGANGSVLNFPLYGNTLTMSFQEFPYFPVIEAPGVVYIQKRAKAGTNSEELLRAAFAGWPILVLTIIMATAAGMIMWAIDCYPNPEEFPRSPRSGFWEGFWWAFISMTTVGYGDKAPKSFLAKIFAFFWILLGLVIIGIFTGTVTTDLTTLSMTKDVTLYSKNLVALNYSEEQRFGAEGNANMISVKNITDFVGKIKTGSDDVTGGLIDSYVAGFEEDKLSSQNGLSVATILDHQYTYGLVLSNDLNNVNTPRCIRRQLSSDESLIVDDIKRTLKALPYVESDEGGADMFDPSSDIFQPAVITCLGIFLFLVLCGVAWEYLYWKPKLARRAGKDIDSDQDMRDISYDGFVLNQCHEMEKTMVDEVVGLYTAFREAMDEIRLLHLQHDPARAANCHPDKIVRIKQ